MIALVDCNSFFCACERVFRPEWLGKPMVVLSNNDGVVIARTEEAKALGIPMGAPFFQIRDFAASQGVVVLSSNYALYGDMSSRVMDLLADFANEWEVYSVDEAFLRVPSGSLDALQDWGKALRAWLLLCTGVPVSVGIAPTKTLAKVANHLAKKQSQHKGVCVLKEQDDSLAVLENFPVADLWGVGRKMGPRLQALGIETALQLHKADLFWVQQHWNILGVQLVRELRGYPIFSLGGPDQPQQQVIASRSFGRPVTSYEDLQQAVASYISRAAEKLRRNQQCCAGVHVYVQPCRDNGIRVPQVTAYGRVMPTQDTMALVATAHALLTPLFQKGARYRKAGIILSELSSLHQPSFFSKNPTPPSMVAMDSINRRYGTGTLRLGACGLEQPWKMRSNHVTQAYTTRWDQLLTVH